MKGTTARTATTLAALLVFLAAAKVEAASEPEGQRQKAESIVVEPGVVPTPPDRPGLPDYGFDVDIWTDRQVYEVGDLVRIYFRVTRPAYVYIFNTDTRGVTRQLFPNFYDRDSYCVPGRRYYIPDATYKLRVIGPPGTEELRIAAVRDRPTFFERRRDYSRDDPFPVYPEGAKGFLREYQRREGELDRDERGGSRGRIEQYEERRERSSDPGAVRRREVAAKRPEAMGGERARPEGRSLEAQRPESIIVEGPGERPRYRYDREYAEAYTTFRVVDTYHRPRPDYYGRLVITSRPSGARVYVDGRYRGRAPETVEYLEPGYHQVEVSLPGFVTWREEIRVHQDTTTRVNVRLHAPRPRVFFDFRF